MKQKKMIVVLLMVTVSLFCSQLIFADNTVELFSKNQMEISSEEKVEQSVSTNEIQKETAVNKPNEGELESNNEKISPQSENTETGNRVLIPVTKGSISIKRIVKSEENLVSLCPEQYTLEGAEYSIYSDSSCTNSLGTFTMQPQKKDDAGKLCSESNMIELDLGKYYIKETKNSKGYIKDDTPFYEVTLDTSKVINIAVTPKLEKMDMTMTFQMVLSYYDDATDTETKEANLSKYQKYFEGVILEIWYYPAYYKDPYKAEKHTPVRKWKFKADKNGVVKYDDAWKTSDSDELFKDDKGNPVGLHGTYYFKRTAQENDKFYDDSYAKDVKQLKENTPFEDLDGFNSRAFDVEEDYFEPLKIFTEIPTDEIGMLRFYIDTFYNGYPTIVYCIEGEDFWGHKVKRYSEIDIRSNGEKSYAKFLSLSPGEYYIKEIKSGRYTNIIQTIPEGFVKNGDKIYFKYFGKNFSGNIYGKLALKTPSNVLGDCHMIVNKMDFIPE